jgi:hypothetical protein
MKKSELREIIREELGKLNEAETQSDTFAYTKVSYGGKPSMNLTLKPEAWAKVKDMFDNEGRPISSEVKKIGASGSAWDIHVKKAGDSYKVYGVSGDFTFGNSPAFYPSKYRGNIRAAKTVLDKFIKDHLE